MAEELNVKKQTDAIDKQEKQLGRLREEIKAGCSHTRNGELKLVPSNNGGSRDGELIYMCSKCRKVIKLSKLPEDTLQNACDVVDRACDVIKISLDLNREDDEKLLKRISKVQFRVRNEIAPFYAASLKKNKRGNGNRRNNNGGGNNDSGIWARPQVNGR